MKILFVAPCWHTYRSRGPFSDGISTYLSLMTNYFVNKGNEVGLVVPNDAEVSDEDNLRYFKLEAPSGEFTAFREKMPWSNYKKVISLAVKEFNPDVIFNHAQHHTVVKGLMTSEFKDKCYHFSHGNPDSYIGERILKSSIKIITCGNANYISWVELAKKLNLSEDNILRPLTLPTVLENRTLIDRPFNRNSFITLSRLFPNKGVEQYIELASKLPNKKFYLFGSRCNIESPKGISVKINGKVYKDTFYEKCIEKALDDLNLPNFIWINRTENWSRDNTVKYLQNFDGWGVSLSPVEAGSTIGCEYKALGIPLLSLSYRYSSFWIHAISDQNETLMLPFDVVDRHLIEGIPMALLTENGLVFREVSSMDVLASDITMLDDPEYSNKIKFDRKLIKNNLVGTETHYNHLIEIFNK